MMVAVLLLLFLHLLFGALADSLAEVLELRIHIGRRKMEAEKEVEVLSPGCLWPETTRYRHSGSPSNLGWRQVYA